mmetsp:Transcript_15543/g.49870  ORF Transcript_15543/g.49870 Transcript_15543/m.49870 type:complete len:224 (-) Transcript_15543:103-774(-)|eukprot:CAMPEP_0185285006 /NCGR_PEP_ID=MMETSP1363-20130426/1449_1 /TAXON_ID=38817 /ORGANISM="Gephyrocapsa oceanica, Strain RCC1303" /LENGTH=223 /DNA_ID=CAMNT_0027880755 /DNA_START=14 /DNA_END=685 /DNA_ORIENTATION=+
MRSRALGASPRGLAGVHAPLRVARISAASASYVSDPFALGPTLALTVLLAAQLRERRPRGWLAPGLLEVRPSLIAGAGRGCFAATALPSGTVLGAYPGRLRSAAEYATKLRVVGPHVAEYCWRIGDVAALDPTDGEGQLYEAPGVPLIEGMPESLRTGAMANWCTPTTLALLNEPGPGGDVNVGVAVEGADVVFSAERDVRRGEELYLDYGQDYDRSGYGGGA